MSSPIPESKQLKTGTTTVGIVCKDGIVLAADRRATAGHFLAHKKVRKVMPITDRMAVTIAGTVSEIQLILKLIRAEIRLKELHTHRDMRTKEVAHLLSNILYHNIRKMSMIPGIAAFLLAGTDVEGSKLFELSPDGTLMEAEDYAADGSGMMFALGVLETEYKKSLTVDQGIELAMKAVNAAIQRDVGSGNGIIVMTITKNGAQTVIEKEINIGLY